MEKDSSATPLHSILVSSNAETVQLISSEVWMQLLKRQFFLLSSVITQQLGGNHKQNAAGTQLQQKPKTKTDLVNSKCNVISV